MKPRISLITLGVDDLEASLAFYRDGLGLETEGIVDGTVATEHRGVFAVEQARRAGAVILKEAVDTFWGGYAGYFLDPDQHLWEVAWNPRMLPKC